MSKKSFEEMMDELDEIILKMESGKVGLDDSIDLFKQGIDLSNLLSKRLEEAKQKITILIEDDLGNIKETEFKIMEDK